MNKAQYNQGVDIALIIPSVKPSASSGLILLDKDIAVFLNKICPKDISKANANNCKI